MPLFSFDVFDGEELWTDTEGTEHIDLAAARHEAVDTITSMSRERFPSMGRTRSASTSGPKTDGPSSA